MPPENQSDTSRANEITIVISGALEEPLRRIGEGLNGISHVLVPVAALPAEEPFASGSGQTAGPPGSPPGWSPPSGSSAEDPSTEGEWRPPDLAIIFEEESPDFAGRLRSFKQAYPRCQILLVGREDSGLSPREIGPALVRHWFFQPLDVAELVNTVRAAGRSLRKVWQEQQRHARTLTEFDALLGRHPRFRETLELAERTASSPTTAVLILGETGTGKGLLARAIHAASPRRTGPFVDINCAAIPANLLESELFGHTKGAFTGALKEKPGLLELADGGTAFLDEIGELDLSLQSKILKFLDDGTIRRLQGTATSTVDVRMIAATNRDLDREVAEGRFRLDLFHRLNVVVLSLPPLRERVEDIPLLANYYLEAASRARGGRPLEWTHAALERLMAYSWPGNVRELINLTERLALLSEGTRPIDVTDLPAGFLPGAPACTVSVPLTVAEVELPPEGIPFEAIERAVLEAALRRTRGNVTQAASLLHMGRGGLRYRLERLKLTDKASNRRGRPMGKGKKAA